MKVVKEAQVPWCVHVSGDFFEVEDNAIRIPAGRRICAWSLSTLLPFILACQGGKSDSNDLSLFVEYVHCPDPEGKVIWKIEKVVGDACKDRSSQ